MYSRLFVSSGSSWARRVTTAMMGLLLLLGAVPAVADSPVFEPKSYDKTLKDNAGINSAVATVVATDKDAGDTITYSFTGGNTGDVFGIDSSSGAITLQKKLDYDSVRKYSLTVEASDGTNTDTALVTVNVKDASIADLIGSTKPMTAVLFSAQDRNRFEVVKDPNSADPTIGIINQNQEGTTGGILIAAEAPFAFPDVGKSTVPIGAWFGGQPHEWIGRRYQRRRSRCGTQLFVYLGCPSEETSGRRRGGYVGVRAPATRRGLRRGRETRSQESHRDLGSRRSLSIRRITTLTQGKANRVRRRYRVSILNQVASDLGLRQHPGP